MQALSQVRTHTLLIVGGADLQVLELNHSAQAAMHTWAEVVIVSVTKIDTAGRRT